MDDDVESFLVSDFEVALLNPYLLLLLNLLCVNVNFNFFFRWPFAVEG